MGIHSRTKCAARLVTLERCNTLYLWIDLLQGKGLQTLADQNAVDTGLIGGAFGIHPNSLR